jgi:hypothetical protein
MVVTLSSDAAKYMTGGVEGLLLTTKVKGLWRTARSLGILILFKSAEAVVWFFVAAKSRMQ